MKKYVLILVMLMCITFTANAQQGVCRVTNGNGATVVVNVVDYNADGTIELSISSDCDDYVNVSFVIKYRYSPSYNYNSSDSQVFNVLASPNRSTSKTVVIRLPAVKDVKLTSVSGIEISSARCQ